MNLVVFCCQRFQNLMGGGIASIGPNRIGIFSEPMVLRPALIDSSDIKLELPQQHSISAVELGCLATRPRGAPREAEEEEEGEGADIAATPSAFACSFRARRSEGECCEPSGCSKACWTRGSGRPLGVGSNLRLSRFKTFELPSEMPWPPRSPCPPIQNMSSACTVFKSNLSCSVSAAGGLDSSSAHLWLTAGVPNLRACLLVAKWL